MNIVRGIKFDVQIGNIKNGEFTKEFTIKGIFAHDFMKEKNRFDKCTHFLIYYHSPLLLL